MIKGNNGFMCAWIDYKKSPACMQIIVQLSEIFQNVGLSRLLEVISSLVIYGDAQILGLIKMVVKMR